MEITSKPYLSLYNAATGMIYLRARFYAPEMNRFSQKDIQRGGIQNPLSLNRYIYCENDSVNFADPSGYGKVWNTIKSAVSGAAKAVTTVINTVKTVKNNVVSTIVSSVTNIVQSAKNKINAYLEGNQQQTSQTTYQSLTEILKNKLGNVNGNNKGSSSSVKGILDQIGVPSYNYTYDAETGVTFVDVTSGCGKGIGTVFGVSVNSLSGVTSNFSMVSSVAAYGGVPGGAEIASVALLAGIVKLIYDGMRNSIQSSKGASDVTVMPMPDSKGDGFIEYLPLPDLDKGGKIETFPEAKEKTDTIVADPPAEEEKESIFADPLPEEKGNQIIADILPQERIDEYLEQASRNPDSDTCVLGKSGKYDTYAEEKGYSHFKLDDETWDGLTNEVNSNYDEIWKVNEKYLRQYRTEKM